MMYVHVQNLSNDIQRIKAADVYSSTSCVRLVALLHASL